MITNMMPQASASAPLPKRSIRPTTSRAMVHPPMSRMAITGSSPSPRAVTSKAYRPNAARATTPTPMTSLASPNRAMPATSSSSRSGVTIRLSRLRDQVSSMKAGRDGDLGLVDDVPEHDPGQQVGDPGLAGRARPALPDAEHPEGGEQHGGHARAHTSRAEPARE